MFHKLIYVNRQKKAFTLVELLIALSIAGIIAIAVTTVIYQISNGSTRGSNHMTAVKQVEVAIHRMSRDIQMAQIVEPTGASGFPLNLTWTEWDNTVNRVTYILEGYRLQRSQSLNDEEPLKCTIAQHINPDTAMTNCEFTGGLLYLTITSTIGKGSQKVSEKRVCEIIPRPGS